MTEQHVARARRSSRKCKTKPMEIGYKSFAFKDLTYDIFGLLYAKRTQFRVVEDESLKGWPCQRLTRRQARTTQGEAAQTGAEWDGQTWTLDNACPPGAAGRVASGEWREQSDQWPVNPRVGAGGGRKATKQSPLLGVLVVRGL